MANRLNYESEIETGNVIQPWHISQSVDAFTGAEEYDINILGTLEVTGSITIGTTHINNGGNIIGGNNNTVSNGGVVLGGDTNTASAYGASVSAGYSNNATGNSSTVAGGYSNCAQGGCSGTFSGAYNQSCAYQSAVLGGDVNTIETAGVGGAIVGGNNHIVEHPSSVIIGGNAITTTTCNTVYVPNLFVTGSTTTNSILQLSRRETSPTGEEGMIISSGSAGASKLYYYNGSTWNALF